MQVPPLGEVPDDAVEVEELSQHGHLLAADLLIQCAGCLERDGDDAEPTVYRLTVTNGQGLDDLLVECPRCAEAAGGVRTVIPITIAIGEEAEEIDDALGLLDGAGAGIEAAEESTEAADDSHPFEGPPTAERPAALPFDAEEPDGS